MQINKKEIRFHQNILICWTAEDSLDIYIQYKIDTRQYTSGLHNSQTHHATQFINRKRSTTGLGENRKIYSNFRHNTTSSIISFQDFYEFTPQHVCTVNNINLFCKFSLQTVGYLQNLFRINKPFYGFDKRLTLV